MSNPIIYVDQSTPRDGTLTELRTAVRELAELVETTQPQLLAYRAHLSDDGRRMTVIHIHSDANSLDRYMQATGPAFARFRNLVVLRRIDLYGDPTAKAVERAHDKARLLGDASTVVEVHQLAAGFSRFRPPV